MPVSLREMVRVKPLLDGIEPEEVRQGNRDPDRPNIYNAKKIIFMGDEYSAEQVAAMGPRAHSENTSFTQLWSEVQGTIDLGALAGQLSTLRGQLSQNAHESERPDASVDVGRAEQAAREGDGPNALRYLGSAGKWAMEAAMRMGGDLGIAAAKAQMGL